MTISFIFWLLMLLWLVFGFWSYWPRGGTAAAPWPVAGSNGFLFILLFLIGWKVFGWPIAN